MTQSEICARVKDDESAARCLKANSRKGEAEAHRACFPFSEPRHLKGVWVADLESSTFFEGAQSFESNMIFDGGNTWLEEDVDRPEITRSMQGEMIRAYRVSLIGRRSLCPGGYGHFGVYRNAVRAEKMLAMHPVRVLIEGPPPTDSNVTNHPKSGLRDRP